MVALLFKSLSHMQVLVRIAPQNCDGNFSVVAEPDPHEGGPVTAAEERMNSQLGSPISQDETRAAPGMGKSAGLKAMFKQKGPHRYSTC